MFLIPEQIDLPDNECHREKIRNDAQQMSSVFEREAKRQHEESYGRQPLRLTSLVVLVPDHTFILAAEALHAANKAGLSYRVKQPGAHLRA
jgi:hypothetical protein